MTARPRAVVKVGGDVLEGERDRAGLAANVKDLVEDGFDVALLHGGGPQTNRLQERLGLVPKKVGGRRITSAEDLLVVEQAICGEVNVALTQVLLEGGVNAFGCHGASGRLIRAVKRPPRVVSGAGPEPIDFGEVGDVVGITTAPVLALWGAGLVPVIATLGVSDEGRVFNINADTTAVQLAAALSADVLLLTTAVGAVFKDLADPASRLAALTPDEATALIADGVIAGGMIPKVEEALAVLDEGVGAICVVGPGEPGAFRAVARGDGGHGTRIQRRA